MKITIEWIHDGRARLTIGDRQLDVVRDEWGATLDGIRSPETEETLGGLIAESIFPKVETILRAWELEPGDRRVDLNKALWKKLRPSLANAVQSRLRGF